MLTCSLLSLWLVQAAPVASGGIEVLETDTYRLHCFQTPTGIKFFLTAALGTPDLDAVLRTVYELYVDYVLKVWQRPCSQLRLRAAAYRTLSTLTHTACVCAWEQNPFYELEMPIRCALFNVGLKTFVDKFNLDSSRRRPQGSDLY